MTGRILVVEHEADAGAGLLGDRIGLAGYEQVTVGPATGHDVPLHADGYDGVVVLGGTPGPTDDEAAGWLPRVRSLISSCLSGHVPYLGVCLGAQLLAVVAGGTVGEVRNGPELGLVPLWPTADTEDDPLLHDLGAGTMALQWHFLEVHQLPVGSASLCRSEACPNQAFRVGPRAWGVQFHLEALAPTAEEWASGDLSQLADLGLDPQQLVAEVRAHEAQLASQWSTVADRWLGIVAEATENDR